MPAIHDSIIAIMKSLDSLPKDKTNPEGWSFRSVDTLIRKLQPLLIEHNIVCTCQIIGLVREQPTRDIRSRSVVSLRYTLTSGKDGSSVSTECAGEGDCLNDKATPKAMTGAWKQMFFQLFMIPVADESDPDNLSLGSASAQLGAPTQPAASPQKPASQPVKSTEQQKQVQQPVVSIDAKTVAAYRAAIAKFMSLYENHDDDYHEIIIKDGVPTEKNESLIQRVDKLKLAIMSQPECATKTSLLEELDKLIAKTNRAEVERKKIVEKISEFNPGTPSQKIEELNAWIESAFGGKMIPVSSYNQVKTAIKQVTGK